MSQKHLGDVGVFVCCMKLGLCWRVYYCWYMYYCTFCSVFSYLVYANHKTIIVSAHRWILGMASVLVKICVSSISLYKLDPDKLTTILQSAHQFTLACTVSDSKTVPGCHYNSCSVLF